MDHGLFSFVDVPHQRWPVILVTNPKHALFHLPGKENPNLQIGKPYKIDEHMCVNSINSLLICRVFCACVVLLFYV